ncbi:S8 family serine peptidase [Alteromonas sp. M12]|uniref:S8 family serine peptidase n=1 Tax=Alteromonas sp. M12 TaxID=3135644 RepID=UPI00319E7003
MTRIKITIFSLLAFSQVSSAQLINTQGITKQVENIEKTVDRLEQKIIVEEVKEPFALSEMPALENLITEPLTTLPKTLAIGADLSNPAFVEVKLDDGWRAVQNQWMILADEQTKQTLTGLGAVINSDSTYSGLGLSILRFTIPSHLDSKSALAKHLTQEAFATLDRNHIYTAQSQTPQTAFDTAHKPINQSLCTTTARIGMIDSAVARTHPAFAKAKITAKSFLTKNLNSPALHGTAVAGVLIGEFNTLIPLLPQAHLYSAEVFYRQSDYSQGATLSAMIDALNWLVEEKVTVINMSLAGPDNRILNRMITAAIQQGTIIVAAAGNEGPAAQAVYPAGYDEVIAVSAFDNNLKPYRWSNRGDYIDYSALGVNVITAQAMGGLSKESGTSMAAPVVSAAIACLLENSKNMKQSYRDAVLASLSDQAIDLGPKGRDPIYGIGAIQGIGSKRQVNE